uniref:Uncharacterized protein n=1 Tax=Anguilla anguilla TaxID=7936 RepID=A0A0E9WYL0_ANGAN
MFSNLLDKCVDDKPNTSEIFIWFIPVLFKSLYRVTGVVIFSVVIQTLHWRYDKLYHLKWN